MFDLRRTMGAAVFAGLIAMGGAASAAVPTGEFWDVNAAPGNAATTPPGVGNLVNANTVDGTCSGNIALCNFLPSVDAIMASRAADATFMSTGIAYPGVNAGGTTAQTLGTWLNGDATTPDLSSTSMLGTIIRITGLVNLQAGNNAFEVFSDDGFRLKIDGAEVGSFAGLRAPQSGPLINFAGGVTGKSALFELVYFEAQAVAAALTVKLNGEVLTPSMVPLPGAALLLLGGLGGLGFVSRKRKAA